MSIGILGIILLAAKVTILQSWVTICLKFLSIFDLENNENRSLLVLAEYSSLINYAINYDCISVSHNTSTTLQVMKIIRS